MSVNTPWTIATWKTEVPDDWKLIAEKILKPLENYVKYDMGDSIGNFSVLEIHSKATDSKISFKVDAKGISRGVIRSMHADTYVFVLIIFAFAKAMRFDLVSSEDKTIKISANPSHAAFKGHPINEDEIDKVALLTGLTIPDSKRYVKGAAAFF